MSATAAILSGATSQAMVGSPFDAVDNDQSLLTIWFIVTPLGNYTAGGDTLDLSGAAFGDAVKSLGPPLDVDIKSFNSAGDSGFVYKYRPGTTSANGKFQVLTSNGASPNPLLDFPAGAYAAGILTDKILGRAVFIRN